MHAALRLANYARRSDSDRARRPEVIRREFWKEHIVGRLYVSVLQCVNPLIRRKKVSR